MSKQNRIRISLVTGFVVVFAAALFAQSATNKTLIINGKTVGSVVQIDGRSYMDVEALAQATNGSVAVEPNRVVLTIPTATSGGASNTQKTPEGLSRNFATAAIAQLAEMREWRGAIGAMVTYGMAVSDKWSQSYHDQAQEGLAQAGVAASTDADRSALQLLQNESAKLASWSDGIIAARKNLSGAATMDPNALQNDPALAKIRSCGQFLNSMLVSGSFADDASCH